MKHDVVVVGGGIGGLTVAALLAARGVDVCLFERGPKTGGCVANFERAGHTFENTYGLFSDWQAGGIHERVFAELPVGPPAVEALQPSYVVRLPDQMDVRISGNDEQLATELRTTFPECSEAAIKFYQDISPLNHTLKKALAKVPDLQTADQKRQMTAFFPNLGAGFQILKASTTKAEEHLASTSDRFRRFLDVQLQSFGQCTTSDCSYLFAAAILDSARRMFSIPGGGAALADCLANSSRQSGGRIRLDTPVLRLAYDASGVPIGIDLLSGERVEATKAIVSNLTIWDTYGKLVGLTQTPSEIKKNLSSLTAHGAYLIYAGMNSCAATRLPCNRLLALTDLRQERYDPVSDSIALTWPASDNVNIKGQLAVTIHNFTNVDDWFVFHEDEAELETADQAMLEACWQRIHNILPELGADIEVIDTATPRSVYEDTRRKLGLVGGIAQLGQPHSSRLLGHTTPFPNLLRVGDTCLPGGGIAGVTHSALVVANHLTR